EAVAEKAARMRKRRLRPNRQDAPLSVCGVSMTTAESRLYLRSGVPPTSSGLWAEAALPWTPSKKKSTWAADNRCPSSLFRRSSTKNCSGGHLFRLRAVALALRGPPAVAEGQGR